MHNICSKLFGFPNNYYKNEIRERKKILYNKRKRRKSPQSKKENILYVQPRKIKKALEGANDVNIYKQHQIKCEECDEYKNCGSICCKKCNNCEKYVNIYKNHQTKCGRCNIYKNCGSICFCNYNNGDCFICRPLKEIKTTKFANLFLPKDVWVNILEFIDYGTFKKIYLVSKSFLNIAKNVVHTRFTTFKYPRPCNHCHIHKIFLPKKFLQQNGVSEEIKKKEWDKYTNKNNIVEGDIIYWESREGRVTP